MATSTINGNTLYTIHIGDGTQSLGTTLQNAWVSNVPNDGEIHMVRVSTQGGAYFGFLTRYANNYGAGLLSRYDGISAGVYLNNGTVTTKPLQN